MQREVQIVVTPRVREEVRQHYNCQELSGAELEDQGEEGTALTHWEKRLFEVEKHILFIESKRDICREVDKSLSSE